MVAAKLENLIGDRAYGNDKPDEDLNLGGIEMTKSHRRKTKPQDGRRLCCHDLWWPVEPFFGCRKWEFCLLISRVYNTK